MTSRNADQTTTSEPRFLTPQEIGWLVKTFRTAHGWTQETLAELSGLQTRTIQRVEQGQPSSADTRRALGRAFALDDINFFNTLQSTPTDEEMRKQKEAFDRDYLLLEVQAVDGRQLLSLMQEGAGYCGICPMGVSGLPHLAQDAFAAIVDFTRDCMDVFDVSSSTDILSYGDSLNESIEALKNSGFCLCAAIRKTKVTNLKWADKTPMPIRVIYLLAAPKDQPATKLAVPRKISGF